MVVICVCDELADGDVEAAADLSGTVIACLAARGWFSLIKHSMQIVNNKNNKVKGYSNHTRLVKNQVIEGLPSRSKAAHSTRVYKYISMKISVGLTQTDSERLM